MAKTRTAKGIRKAGSRPEKLSPRRQGDLISEIDRLSDIYRAEVRSSIGRCIRFTKAEAIGADMDRGKTQVHEYASGNAAVPGDRVFYLAIHDADPECLLRIANLYRQAAEAVAVARKKRGGSVAIFQQSARLDFGEDA